MGTGREGVLIKNRWWNRVKFKEILNGNLSLFLSCHIKKLYNNDSYHD